MSEYEVVYQSIIDSFNIDMFGQFSNSVTRDQFAHQLASDGWKYFDRKNLNELFFIKYQECVNNGTMPFTGNSGTDSLGEPKLFASVDF